MAGLIWSTKIQIVIIKYEISSWYHWLWSIRVHNSQIQNNGSNMAEQNNKVKRFF